MNGYLKSDIKQLLSPVLLSLIILPALLQGGCSQEESTSEKVPVVEVKETNQHAVIAEASPIIQDAPAIPAKQSIKLIYKLDPAQRVRVNNAMVPRYAYDPRPDTKRSLANDGFSVFNRKQPVYDLALTVEYTERMQASQSYGGYGAAPSVVLNLFRVTLKDSSDTVLFSLKHFMIGKKGVKNYITNQLSTDISERLTHDNETDYLLSKFDQQMQSADRMHRSSLGSSISLLVRLFELKDTKAEKAFLQALWLPDPRQRWIAKIGLLELGLKPAPNSHDFVPFEMVNLFTSSKSSVFGYFLRSIPRSGKEYANDVKDRSLRSTIIEYGEPAIAVIVYNSKCMAAMNDSHWYGGGQISKIRPDLVLKSLRKSQPKKYTRRYARQPVKEWRKPEWRKAAISILTQQLSEDHPDLQVSFRDAYYKTLLDILSELGNKKTIPFLEAYIRKHTDLASECNTAITKINQRA